MMSIISVQGLPFLACLAMLAILGYIGLHVLKREIIFIDIALAQIAAVGAIAAHVVFHIHGQSIYAHLLALGSTLLAAAFFAVVRRRITQIPVEAVIGVCYATSAAAALFLVGVAPGGHVHIQAMLAGSILWATWGDVLWGTAVFAAVGVCFYLFRKPFRVISENYEEATAQRYNTLGWDFLFYALVGVVITVAVRIAGVVLVFTFLIIPATLSVGFARGWAGRLGVASVAGAVSAALGLLFADRYDFSVGPAIGLFLGATLIVVSLLRAMRVARVATAATWLLVASGLGVWFAAGSNARSSHPVGGIGGIPSTSTITHSHSHAADPTHEHMAHHDADEFGADRLDALTDIKQLKAMYTEAGDAEQRSRIAGRALEVDMRVGASMVIEFLKEDPPLLFRLTIVEKLEAITGRAVPYDIDQPFAAPANQKALNDLLEQIVLE